jgi:hypothetical protein
LTRTALEDRDRLSPASQMSLRHVISQLEVDPSPRAPYRQEFDLATYGRRFGVEIPAIANARFVRWAYGNVIVEYLFAEDQKVAIILALSPTPPLL